MIVEIMVGFEYKRCGSRPSDIVLANTSHRFVEGHLDYMNVLRTFKVLRAEGEILGQEEV